VNKAHKSRTTVPPIPISAALKRSSAALPMRFFPKTPRKSPRPAYLGSELSLNDQFAANQGPRLRSSRGIGAP
jgi:hypothetical protein